MTKLKISLIGTLLVFLMCYATKSLLPPKKINCTVTRVIDGDSFTAIVGGKLLKIRLYGLDAPESTQDYGQEAKHFTDSLISNKEVQIQLFAEDKYGRSIAMVWVNDLFLNQELIKHGCAWHYSFFDKSQYFNKWEHLQDSCKINHIGLWSNNSPIEPSKYRKLNK